jgi:hypothetical protein
MLHVSTQTALLVGLAASLSGAVDKVVFTIYAEIQFAVPADWQVVANKSDTKSTLFAFKIPNPAEEGTPDSTNLVLQSFYLKEPEAKATFEEKSKPQDPGARKRTVGLIGTARPTLASKVRRLTMFGTVIELWPRRGFTFASRGRTSPAIL